MEVRINLNESVKFTLSERGNEVYRHRYEGLEPKLDDDGYMSMQLWTFMWMFGEYMVPGISELIQPLEIIYESEDERDFASLFNKSFWRMGMHDTAVIPRTMVDTSTNEGDAESATTTDCISRADAIEAWDKLSKRGRTEFDQVLMTLPSADAEQTDCTDFINWLLEEVMDEENWELNAVANGEIICRKLKKLDLLEVKDGYYVRASVTPEGRTGEWIPVSKRLPEDGVKVLCCDKRGDIYFGCHENTGWYWEAEACADYWTKDPTVIAWMLLPEPYKGGDTE